MVSILINDVKYKCPSCWAEVKTRQYIRIVKEWDQDIDIADRDWVKLLGILIDKPFTAMYNDIENQVNLTTILSWVLTENFDFENHPKVIALGNVRVDIPDDIKDLSIGQNIHLRRDYIDKSKRLEENISIAIAIYLQPKIDNSLFKIKRAEEISKQVDELPITLTYQLGFFLLSRAMGLGMKHVSYWQAVKISLAKILVTLWPSLQKYKGLTGTKIYP